MSRSNPTANDPNPSTRFWEWKGGKGILRYYDKEQKQEIVTKLPFRCIVLDRLSTVTGHVKRWKSNCYSNEVRDTRTEGFVVKCFGNPGTLGEGLWNDIKTQVGAYGAGFTVSLYIGFLDDKKTLQLGNIKLAGCACGAWFEFDKLHRKAIYEKGLIISAGPENATGAIRFTPPQFSLCELTPETQAAAVDLDRQLQGYLDEYFKRTHVQRVDAAPQAQDDPAPVEDQPEPVDEDSSVPF